MNPIRFLQPTFPPPAEVAADYAAILERGMFSNGGPLERQFTAGIESWVGGCVRASTVASCTLGIELAIRATFNPARALAIVPSFTFPAGPLALRTCGYQPTFVDVSPNSWQPDVAAAADFLADRHTDVAGILLTATFGVADAGVAEWEQLADRYGLALVIDSAAGFGAVHTCGEPAGARGRCEVFSMHATKMLAVGEGGLITSRDSDLIDRLDRMKNFGFDKDRQSVGPGTNGKLAELTAAIGLRQLAALPDRIALRRQAVRRYRDALEPLGVTFQPGAELSAPTFASTLLPNGEARDAVGSALESAGVECRHYYNPPVHRQPFFTGSISCGPLSTTDDFAGRILSLPMSDQLEPEVADRVADVVGQVLNG